MARETKVGLIVGLGVILFVSVFVSDYLSKPETAEALPDAPSQNFVENTTNQPEFTLVREDDTDPAVTITDPIELAAVRLAGIEERQGPPSVTIDAPVEAPPFRRTDQPLTGTIDDSTPLAQNPRNPDPIGFNRIDDTQLAQRNQLSPDRQGPVPVGLGELPRVDITEPQLINAHPVTIEHTVKPGETLTAIARKHYDGDGNLWRSIRDANPGKVGTNGEIVQGVTLIIPKRSTEANDPTGDLAERSANGGDRPQRQRVRMITVKEGDTLGELAAKHLGSSGKYPLIMAVNTDVLDKPEHLRAGMKLRIPAEQVAEVIEEANEALTTVTPTDVREAIERIESNTYTVKEGDSLSSIAGKLLGDANRYDDIYKANKDKLSSADDIRVGMLLKLPTR